MRWAVFERYDLYTETLVATFETEAEAKSLAFSLTGESKVVHVARPLPEKPARYFPGPGRAATSRAAYQDAVETLPERARAVYRFIADRAQGANEYEVEIGMRILHQSVSSITLILRRAGLLIPLRAENGGYVSRPSRTKGHSGVVYVAVHPAHAKPDPTAGTNPWKRAATTAYAHLKAGNADAARAVLAAMVEDP